MRNITVLSGGNGGAALVSSLLDAIASGSSDSTDPQGTLAVLANAHLTVIANTADDLWLHGLKVCPDLDVLMHALRPETSRAIEATADSTHTVHDEILAYGVEPGWYSFSDRETGTHLVRTQMLEAGYPLSAVTAALTRRWNGDVTLLPMTDDRVETHVAVHDPASPSGRRAVHLQEYRRSLHATPTAEAVVTIGLEQSAPAPGVLDAIAEADLVLIAPSDLVASIGPLLAVPGVREALRSTSARVVGVSPLIGSRGFDSDRRDDAALLQFLQAAGVPASTSGVAMHLGARVAGGVLDAWIVDPSDGDAVADLENAGLSTATAPLRSRSADAMTTLVRAVVGAASEEAH